MNSTAIFLILTLLVSTSTGGSEKKDDSISSDTVKTVVYHERSDLWPNKVAIRKPLTGKKHNNTLPVGFEGMLIRIEEDICIVDFGHNGIFELSCVDTDITERITQAEPRTTGMFSERYEKMFFDIAKGRGLTGGSLNGYQNFLIFYFPFSKESNQSDLALAIRRHREELTKEHKTEVLLVTYESIVDAMKEYILAGFNAPTVSGFLNQSFIHANQHQPTGTTGVLIDRHGKILYRSNGDFVETDEFFTQAKQALSRSSLITK